MTTSILVSEKPKPGSLVNKYPLTIFFLLVFGLTWPFMIVDALGSHEILPFRLPDPTFAGYELYAYIGRSDRHWMDRRKGWHSRFV